MAFAHRDIEEAYFFVNAASMSEHQAVLCKDTGEIHYASEEGDEMALPDSVEGNEACVAIPHRNELNLGTRLVHEFVAEHSPDLADQVRRIFSRKGAYRRFKDLLDRKRLLDTWHALAGERQAQALRQWCAANGIEVKD